MSAGELEQGESGSFVVVLRAPAGFYVSNGDPLPTMRFGSEIGPVELDARTARTTYPGFDRTVRTGIWVEVRGDADSLGQSVEVFANFARGIAAVLGVIPNATVGDLTAEIMYDATPGRKRRPYWRRWIQDSPPVLASGRKLPAGAAVAAIRAWMSWLVSSASDTDRLYRAYEQYHEALRHWEPGLEIDAIGRLWIGLEALTPLMVRHILSSEGVTRDQLAARYSVEEKHLDAEVRLRHFFHGDKECYQQVRGARVNLQHSLRPLWEVRDSALEAREKTAGYLRAAIFEMTSIDGGSKSVLLSPPYNQPMHWSSVVEMHGWTVGDGPGSAQPEDLYPRVDWYPKLIEGPSDEEGDATVDLETHIGSHLAEGYEFEFEGTIVLRPRDDPH